MDTGDCQLLYHAIRDYFERINMKIDQQIPMLLVGRQALNEASVGEKNVIIVSVCVYLLLFRGIFLILKWFHLGRSSHGRDKGFMSF